MEWLERRELLAGDFQVALAFGIGGVGTQQGRAIAADADGNLYVAGRFDGNAVDFDPGSGITNLANHGGADIFVAKYGAGGNLIWARGFGSTGSDQGEGIAVDGAGRVYVVGTFSGMAVFGTETLTAVGGRDAFVARLDSAGNVQWVRGVGGAGNDDARGVAIDAAGSFYVSGTTIGAVDFDPGSGTSSPTPGVAHDAYVLKLDAAGDFVWAARSFGIDAATDGDAGALAVAVSASAVYATGRFTGEVDFDPGSGSSTLLTAGGDDTFVWKLDPASGGFSKAWRYGSGNVVEAGSAIALDSLGNVVIGGKFQGTVDFDIGPGTTTLSSTLTDAFVTKTNADGGLLWAHNVAEGGFDDLLGLSLDGQGNVWSTGNFSGTADFLPGPATFPLHSNGSADVFVWGLTAGGDFLEAFSAGALGVDSGQAVAAAPGGRVAITGFFEQTVDFDPGPLFRNLTSGGGQDAFVWAISRNAPPTDILLSNSSVPENSVPGTVVGELSAVDPNSGDTFTFTLTNSAEGRFAIVESQLRVADGAPLDFETNASHSISVRVTDAAGAIFEKPLSIQVTNVNEAPFNLALAGNSVPENSPGGTLVGTLSASDVDVGDTLTFSLTNNAGGRFTLNGTQVVVAEGAVLDFEAADSHEIMVRVSDGGLFQERTFKIDVLDVNEKPVVTLGGPVTIDEGSTFASSGSFTDPDPGNWTATVDYGDGAGPQPLLLNGNKTFALSHVYADNGSYPVTVVVKDQGNLTGTATQAVSVLNVAPQNLAIGGATSGVRGQTLGFSASFFDPGSADTHEVAWDFGDGGVSGFRSTTVAGALTPSHVYTTSGTFTLTVTIRDDDGGQTSFSRNVTIAAAELKDVPGGQALVIGGTPGADVLRVLPDGSSGGVQVQFNGASLGPFANLVRIVAYGQAGDDDLQVSGSVAIPAWLFGGDGNDRLKGGGSHDALFGDAGDDQILGGSGRDLLVGGSGADRIIGNADEDILLAGSLQFSDVDTAIFAIMAEWTSSRSFHDRVANLTGHGSGEQANGDTFLIEGQTVIEDGQADLLTGAAGTDWFFYDPTKDTATDQSSEESSGGGEGWID